MTNEFRQDPLSGDWVVIAPARSKKPENGARSTFAAHDCPFDDPQKAGQERPIVVYSRGKKIDTTDGWTIQVIPNKYPAVLPGQCGPVMKQGLYSVAAGTGAHELVITRDHDRHFADFSDEEMAEVIGAYLDRYRALASDSCNKYTTIFHNHGILAGASIYHNHSQILTTPIVPPHIGEMFGNCARHYKKTGRRLVENILAEESKRGICDKGRFTAFCPFAGRSSYEVNIFPKMIQPDFGMLDDTDTAALASLMREVFVRLNKALNDPDYTFFIHTSGPENKDSALDCHIEIMPRFSPAAGFEFGTGVFVNAVDPDEAAKKLRSVAI